MAQTISAATKTEANAAARFSAEPLVPTGMYGAACGENHCAANQAATQPTSDSTSNTKPRIAPTITEITSTASKAASTQPICAKSMARPSEGQHHGIQPGGLRLGQRLLGLFARIERADAHTVRLPLEVSTTWV